MSKILLSNIDIIEPRVSRNSMIVGDIVNGGGYVDPIIVTNQTDLERKFRFSENYESYKAIIEAGGTLALVGNKKKFGDIPTLVIFNQNPSIGLTEDSKIPAAHPLYDELFKNYSELIKDVSDISPFLALGDNLTERLNLFTGFSEDRYKTYRLEILANSDDIYSSLESDSESGKVSILVLPIYSLESSLNLNVSFFLQVKNSENDWIPDTDLINETIGLDSQGIVGNCWIVRLDTSNGVCSITIFNRITPELSHTMTLDDYDTWTNEAVFQALKRVIDYSGAYTRGEIISVMNTDGEYSLVIESPYLLQYFDFCSAYCNSLDIICDTEYTQRIYYLRGILNQGIVLSSYSKFANKEGRNIEFHYQCENGRMNLLIDFLNEEYEYQGENILEDLKSNPLVTIVDLNYETHNLNKDSFESIVPLGIYDTDSYGSDEWDLDSLISSYESFFEYEVNASVILAPRDLKFWRRTPIISELKKFHKDHLVGGMNSTVCIQVDEGEEEYIQSIQNSLGIEVFWFSGSFNYPSVYQYLEKWFRDREFTDDPGYSIIKGFDNTLTFTYTGYSIAYETNNNFILSLAISHLLNTLYGAIYPGINQNEVEKSINNGISYVKNYNGILEDVIVNSIEQNQNTLIIDIDVYYNSIPDSIKINFKLYKSYD